MISFHGANDGTGKEVRQIGGYSIGSVEQGFVGQIAGLDHRQRQWWNGLGLDSFRVFLPTLNWYENGTYGTSIRLQQYR
jgi:hypothetical protein